MDCDYGYNFVGDKLARKHWTMREMMKKTGMQLIALVEGYGGIRYFMHALHITFDKICE